LLVHEGLLLLLRAEAYIYIVSYSYVRYCTAVIVQPFYTALPLPQFGAAAADY
jgi:hypothetical protein